MSAKEVETVLAPTIRWTQSCKRLNVGYWHKADMLNALTNVRFWGNADMDQPLLTKLDLRVHGQAGFAVDLAHQPG